MDNNSQIRAKIMSAQTVERLQNAVINDSYKSVTIEPMKYVAATKPDHNVTNISSMNNVINPGDLNNLTSQTGLTNLTGISQQLFNPLTECLKKFILVRDGGLNFKWLKAQANHNLLRQLQGAKKHVNLKKVNAAKSREIYNKSRTYEIQRQQMREAMGEDETGTDEATIDKKYGLKTGVSIKDSDNMKLRTGVNMAAPNTVVGLSIGNTKSFGQMLLNIRSFSMNTKTTHSYKMDAIEKEGTGIFKIIYSAIQKAILPVCIAAAVGTAAVSNVVSPMAFIGMLFGNVFDEQKADGTTQEVDIRGFLSDENRGVPKLRMDYINNLNQYMQDQLVQNGGEYHVVRFRTNLYETPRRPSVAAISKVFYTDDELINIIQPIFNAIALKDYELTLPEGESDKILNELFNKLFRTDELSTLEYCGQSLEDGIGEVVLCPECNEVHAYVNCPNHQYGVHSEYTCSRCCMASELEYPELNEGETENPDENPVQTESPSEVESPNEIDNSIATDDLEDTDDSISMILDANANNDELEEALENDCIGYDNCGGHKILTVTLSMDGLYQLEQEYFIKPIEELEAKGTLTDDEQKKLDEYKDYQDIYNEYIQQIPEYSTNNLTPREIETIQFSNSSNMANKDVVDVALEQCGQAGGEPYWSWYGYTSRVDWSACFVSWVMDKTGHSDIRFATSNPEGVNYFKENSHWQYGDYQGASGGDVIFFDWDADSEADHVGIVIGQDDKFIYTVEGNASDACRIKKYPLGSSCILGYGIL